MAGTVKIRFIKDWQGYKAGSVWEMLLTKYYELKQQGIVNLVAGDVREMWAVIDEEE